MNDFIFKLAYWCQTSYDVYIEWKYLDLLMDLVV